MRSDVKKQGRSKVGGVADFTMEYSVTNQEIVEGRQWTVHEERRVLGRYLLSEMREAEKRAAVVAVRMDI